MKKALTLTGVLSVAMILASCGNITGTTSGQPSSGTTTTSSTTITTTGETTTTSGKEPVNMDIVTGDMDELNATGLSFQLGEEDGEVVSLKEVGNKTEVYGMHAGVAHLVDDDGGVYNIKVSYATAQGGALSTGDSYLRYLKNANEETTDFKKGSGAYLVGTQNAFKFDAGFVYYTWEKDPDTGDFDYATAKIELSEALDTYLPAGEKITITVKDATLSDICTVDTSNATLLFKEAAVGNTYEFSVKHKTSELKYKLTINDGVNIYSHLELKQYYEDESFSGSVNILRNIHVELLDEQTYFIGQTFETAKEYSFNTLPAIYEDQFPGSAYFRGLTEESAEDPIIINGNYMQIDASDVQLQPLGKTEAPFKTFNHNGEEISVIETEAVKIGNAACNPQEGIFRCHDYTTGAEYDDTIGTKVVYNYLEIRGNSNYAVDPSTPEEEYEEEAQKLSQGKIGIVCGGTKAELNNTIVEYATFGTTVNWGNGVFQASNTIIRNTWGANVQTYRCHEVNLMNTDLSSAGAGTIWTLNTEQLDYGTPIDTPTIVELDDQCKIDNRIEPDSPWLVTYNLKDKVTTIRDTIDGMVKPMGMTVLDDGCLNLEFGLQHPNEQGFSTYPYADVTIGDNQQVICQKAYDSYPLPTDDYPNNLMNPLAWVKQVKTGNSGTILKSFGQSDQELGQAMLDNGISAIIGGGSAPTTEQVTQCYGLSLATDLTTRYFTQGKQAHLLLDIYMEGFGYISVLIEIQALPK